MAFHICRRFWRSFALLPLALGLSGCASHFLSSMTAQECMTRVMYFESNRTSQEGMIAVGTVVMNRVESPKYPDTVCEVVGQKNQFAPGVLTRSMEAGRELAAASAHKVLNDRWRHRKVGNAFFFHTAGMTFPYTNMHYLVEAGGNVFYEKRKNARRLGDPPFRNPGTVEVTLPSQRPELVPVQVRSSVPSGSPARVPTRATTTALQPISIDDLIAASGN